MQQVFAVFLLVSGFAGLLYQVVWVRLLSQSLGSTSASVAIVVAAFFLGLAIGSRFADRLTLPGPRLRAYALLEAAIGVSALLLLPLLLHLDGILALAPGFAANPALKAALCVALLLLPTTAMGASFPLAAGLLETLSPDAGRQISRLYSFNTIGAVLGAGLSGLVIIPALGLDGAVYLAAAGNLLVAAVAFTLIGRDRSETLSRPADAASPVASAASRLAQATLALTGFISIASQVGWTKFLVIAIGGTVAGFSLILALFLAGIAIGAWLMGQVIARLTNPIPMLVALLALLPLALLLSRAMLSLLPALQAALVETPWPAAVILLLRASAVATALLPPTLLLGASFPLLVLLACGRDGPSQARIGAAYAVNTLGSIAGASLAGLYAIPAWGTDRLLLAMALMAGVTALMWLPHLRGVRPHAAAAAILLIAGLAATRLPGLDYRSMIAAAGYDSRSQAGESPTFHFLAEGRAGVVSLASYDGRQMILQSNGLNEAGFTLGEPEDVPLAETLLGLLPAILHSDPKTALVIGLGAGNTAAALALTDLSEIRIVEIEPAIAAAARHFADGPARVLDDDRVSITFNDARNTLAAENRLYDLIVSQPSHPWVAGTAGVFTRDFWDIASRRLDDGGIFAQWLNLFRMNAVALKAVLRAFFEAFPEGFVLVSDDSLILIGANGPVVLDEVRANAMLAQPAIAARLRQHGLGDAYDLLAAYVLSRDEALDLAGDTPANLDRNILSETQLALLLREPAGDDDPRRLLAAAGRMDPTALLAEARDDSLPVLIRRLLASGRFARAERAIATLADSDPRQARGLGLQLDLAQANFARAFPLYDRYSGWDDAVSAAQARGLSEVGRFDRARAAARSIADPALRAGALARLAFVDPAGASAPSDARTPEAELWMLLSQLRSGAATADSSRVDALLGKAARDPADRILAARALLAAAERRGDQRETLRQARALAEAASAQARRLVAAGHFAEAAGDLPLLGEILAQIYSLDATTPGYEALRQTYAKQVPAD